MCMQLCNCNFIPKFPSQLALASFPGIYHHPVFWFNAVYKRGKVGAVMYTVICDIMIGRHTQGVPDEESRVLVSCPRSGDWNVGKAVSTHVTRSPRPFFSVLCILQAIKYWSQLGRPGKAWEQTFHNTNKQHKSWVQSYDHIPLGLDLQFHCTFFGPMDTDFSCDLIHTNPHDL